MWRRALKYLTGLAFVCVAGLGILVAIQEDRDVDTQIVIDAPVADVWRVLAATDKYATWNPLIRDVSGVLAPGGTIHVTIVTPDGNTDSYDATLIGYVVEHELRWEHDLPIPRLLIGKHKLIIDPSGPDKTQLRHEKEFRGLFAGPLIDGYLDRLRLQFDAMNLALKRRVEGGG